MFTIEVKKRGKDEEFGFEGLFSNGKELFGGVKVIHEDCYGGKVR